MEMSEQQHWQMAKNGGTNPVKQIIKLVNKVSHRWPG